MKLVTIAIAAALSLSSGATLAQPAAPPKGDPAARPLRQRPDPAQMEARRADHLKTVLQLRADQEPALRAYLDALRPPAAAAGAKPPQRPDPQALRQMTTPQRLDRMQARLDEAQARFRRVADATRRFYGQLSPSQQKAFDALRPMGGGPRGRMMRPGARRFGPQGGPGRGPMGGQMGRRFEGRMGPPDQGPRGFGPGPRPPGAPGGAPPR